MSDADIIGRTVGKFRILTRLGAGGMGEVYEAEDTSLGRLVAVKVLPHDVGGDADRRARFEREARAVAALEHPGIVTMHGLYDVDGRMLLVMERVRGSTLADLLPPAGFPLAKVLDFGVELASAIAVAHEHGIVHRDLKPTNVMVTDEGRVKLLDFGVARRTTPGSPDLGGAVTETATGTVVGTVAYMSPEQAQARATEATSDVFSLGVLLFELATGRRPFAGDSAISIGVAIVRDTPRAPSALEPSLPPEFDAIVARCLEKDPSRRYRTARELEHALVELRGAPSRTGPAPVAPHAPPGRASKAALVGAVLALLVVAGGVAAYVSGVRLGPSAATPSASAATTVSTPPSAPVAPTPSSGGALVIPSTSSARPSVPPPATAPASASRPGPTGKVSGGLEARWGGGACGDRDCAKVRAAIEAQKSAIDACYARNQLDGIDHQFEDFALTIAEDGTVTAVAPASVKPCPIVDACVVPILRAIRFGPADLVDGGMRFKGAARVDFVSRVPGT